MLCIRLTVLTKSLVAESLINLFISIAASITSAVVGNFGAKSAVFLLVLSANSHICNWALYWFSKNSLAVVSRE